MIVAVVHDESAKSQHAVSVLNAGVTLVKVFPPEEYPVPETSFVAE